LGATIRVMDATRWKPAVFNCRSRRGVKGFLLGSETPKVLTHSKIPVLVFL